MKTDYKNPLDVFVNICQLYLHLPGMKIPQVSFICGVLKKGKVGSKGGKTVRKLNGMSAKKQNPGEFMLK